MDPCNLSLITALGLIECLYFMQNLNLLQVFLSRLCVSVEDCVFFIDICPLNSPYM
jgi:hypothetical protein